MQTDITFIHTSPAHIERFDDIMAQIAPERSVKHVVKAELLTQAMQGDVPASQIQAEFEQVVEDATEDAQVVVCTCSTLGIYVDDIREQREQVLRIDQAMADQAVGIGSKIVVAATISSTLIPTRELIEATARKAGKSIEIIPCLCSSAWTYFEQGDNERYVQEIVRSLEECQDQGDVIVLAQASMADAVAYCQDFPIPVLSSPLLGVQSALQALR